MFVLAPIIISLIAVTKAQQCVFGTGRCIMDSGMGSTFEVCSESLVLTTESCPQGQMCYNDSGRVLCRPAGASSYAPPPPYSPNAPKPAYTVPTVAGVGGGNTSTSMVYAPPVGTYGNSMPSQGPIIPPVTTIQPTDTTVYIPPVTTVLNTSSNSVLGGGGNNNSYSNYMPTSVMGAGGQKSSYFTSYAPTGVLGGGGQATSYNPAPPS
ncbi:hypothetical protein AX774_g4446 [Zancudomyces culisetae]|uniref:Carbohydrate-binding module family 19 domain-containing protein n=1 Tax=Zancudomyces culisetae TaxID=1213189 RepID=A0A1R1PMB4_ZANCU|nr:hypothetical protein AX774_g4446 [Zancudomyces culisetae]|eukprot:OMH82087.1 hypothetical protein AX774_g4446 [Zancudomyces culisetae]